MQNSARIKSLEIKIIEHCNFRCKGCYTFSNIAKAGQYDLAEYEADLARVSSLFALVNNIRILGGEPLLAKNILEYLLIARRIFPTSDITLVTNGFLLDEMEEEFFTTLKQHEIAVSISYYTGETRQKVKKGIKKLQDKGIKFYVYPTSLFCIEHAETRNEDAAAIYNACKLRIKPVTMYKGRIYACPKPFSVKHYDTLYGTSYENPADGIDLSQEISGQDILKHLEKPMETCHFCSLRPGYAKWGQGKPEAIDWVNSAENKLMLDAFTWYDYLQHGNHLRYNVLEIAPDTAQPVKNHFFTEKEIKEKLHADIYLWLAGEKTVYLYTELLHNTLKSQQIVLKGIIDTGDFTRQHFACEQIVSHHVLTGHYYLILLVADYNDLYTEMKKVKKNLMQR